MNTAGQRVVLLIEDDTLITVSLTSALQKNGYAVVREDNGERGVEAALTNLSIDLVLMDIMLGTGINGIQAARQILNERSLPIIFLTAATDPELVDETTGIPAYGFVHKTAGKAILIASVNMALRLFDLQMEERRKDVQLKMAEANFETVFQRSPALMVISNLQTGEIVAVNEEVVRATGRCYEELVGKKTTELDWASLDDQRKLVAILAADGRVKEQEVAFFTKNGKDLECIFNAEVIPFRGEPHVLSLIQNISERKQAERALEANEAKVRTVFNTMEEGMALNELVFDSAGEIVDYRILDVNTAFEQISTLSREQAVGKLATEIYPGMSSEGINQFWKAHLDDEHSIKTDMYVEEIQRWRHISTSKPVNNRFVTLFFDNTEQKVVEEQLRRSLQEKETLLRELYHRTKNNMAVIIAMLNLQAIFAEEQELKDALMDAQGRIRSMALVHEKLYDAKDLSRLNLKDYFLDLVALTTQSYPFDYAAVEFKYDLSDVLVLIDTAIPCGLIMNELISNAIKYAFPAGRTGEVQIGLRQLADSEVEIWLSDNGVGLPEGFDCRKSGKLGMKTIFMIGEGQLQGKVEFEQADGLTCRVRFKDVFYQARI